MTENEIRIINGKEIVLYREIETDLYRFSKDVFDMLLQAFEEAEQYRVIGTVEEFKALKEKSMEKKPKKRDCVTLEEALYLYEPYCDNCGQKLDWSDEE